MTSNNHNEIANYESQSRESLTKSRQHPAAGDLPQASEKGWHPTTPIAKTVTLSQNWQYPHPSQFHRLINQPGETTANPSPPIYPAAPKSRPSTPRSQIQTKPPRNQPRY